MVVKTVTVKDRVPPAFLIPPPSNWSKPGGPATVGDFVERGDVNGSARNVCAMRLAKVSEWDKQ
ncbi:MAG: hypothetical protein EOS63_17400 [Mesorhizobium sp.]|uniref:hypothetical protein n=1 Tax=Mesorhizobium sp. TaxID=1871066 RepID=UPI000FE75D10|nr:hypothetical protein [Mesorhizobium sp.]RWE78531.1 MAG: hypothetical protein EOS63_17400 [Mesorhizobium sp.]TJW61020.1 MAG: hypothetical protein E5V97_22145 [Mesorhizobium sp.]